MQECKYKVFVHSKNYGQEITTFRPIFGHFQVSKKLKELAYICVRCKNMLRTIKNIHLRLCEWNPTAFNQQRWYPSFLRCFFPVYQCAFRLWMKPYSYSLIWLSRTIGSMKRTKFISVDKTLSIFSKQQLKVNFSAFQWWRIQTFR